MRLSLIGPKSMERFESPLHRNTLAELKDPHHDWHSGGSGGATVEETDGGNVVVRAFTGARTLAKGQSMELTFELLLTPCVRLNTSAHFGNQGRYFQYSHSNSLQHLP